MTNEASADMSGLTPTDCRRAAAIWAHYAARDHDGILAILTEAGATGSGYQLLMAVLAVAGQHDPSIFTNAAKFRDAAERFARDEAAL